MATPRTEREARDLAHLMLNRNSVKGWGVAPDLAAFARCGSCREVVSPVYEEWARKEGKPRWGA